MYLQLYALKTPSALIFLKVFLLKKTRLQNNHGRGQSRHAFRMLSTLSTVRSGFTPLGLKPRDSSLRPMSLTAQAVPSKWFASFLCNLKPGSQIDLEQCRCFLNSARVCKNYLDYLSQVSSLQNSGFKYLWQSSWKYHIREWTIIYNSSLS